MEDADDWNEGPPEFKPGSGRTLWTPGPIGGASGDGDWGSEGPPEIELQPGAWAGGGSAPTDGWGDWTDPRVNVALVASLVPAIARDGQVSTRGLMTVLQTARALGAALTAMAPVLGTDG